MASIGSKVCVINVDNECLDEILIHTGWAKIGETICLIQFSFSIIIFDRFTFFGPPYIMRNTFENHQILFSVGRGPNRWPVKL